MIEVLLMINLILLGVILAGLAVGTWLETGTRLARQLQTRREAQIIELSSRRSGGSSGARRPQA